jgi:hypothetical protein
VVQLQPVDSSSIELVAYEAETKRLYIRFRDSGEAYVYRDVPPLAYTGLMLADSKGRYLNRSIKPRYKFERLRHRNA